MKTRLIIIIMAIWCTASAGAQSLKLDGLLLPADGSTTGRMVAVHLDAGSQTLQTLKVVAYSLYNGQNTESADYIDFGNGLYTLSLPQTTGECAYQVCAVLADGTQLKTEMIELDGVSRFRWIGSDVKWTSYTTGYAPDTPRIDGSIDYKTNPFNVGGISFYKSFSTHGKGSFTFRFEEGNPYSRFYTHYGIQDNKDKGDVRFSFKVNGELKETHDMYSKTNAVKPADGIYLRTFETPIDGETTIELIGDVIDDYTHDHMNFPMGRIYLKPDTRSQQTSTWPATAILAADSPFEQVLKAEFTSGGTVYYRIVSGEEYATLDGDRLNVHTIPSDKLAYIEVEAFQPGTDDYLPGPVYRCKFYVRNNKVVPKDGKLTLTDGDELDELTVYADPTSCGQVLVDNGMVSVKRLVLKYTFVPGKWNFISFPANLNIDKVSNLNELGYTYNSGSKAYYIRRYSTRLRAEQPEKTAWEKLLTPQVIRNQGYIMGVSRSADNPDNIPVEVTFVLDNVSLGMDADMGGSMNVALNLMQVEPGTEVPVYVMPDGVKGAPLKVMVRFSPSDRSVLPMNYAAALDEMRVTFNPNRSGIRLTLPTEEKARVVIFDQKCHIVKAINYESPYLIDIRDLKPGNYTLHVSYGNATTTCPLEITK